MGDFFRSDTGSLVQEDDGLEQAFLDGRIGLKGGSTVNLVRDDGTIEEYRAEDAAQVLSAGGYRFERDVERQAREEAASYDERNVEAALAGAARGLTFGGSDYALSAAGITSKETLAKLQEYNPYVSGAGEAAGILGGALLTGGAGGLSALRGGVAGGAAALGAATEAAVAGTRLVQAAEAGGTLARAGAAAARLGAQGAVEGALYGAAQRVNEDWLHDREITVERIAAGTTLGALTGGAFGAGAGVLSSLSSSALKAAADKVGTLDSFMSQRAVKAIVGQTSKKQITLAGRFGEDMEAGIEHVGKTILDDWSEAGFNLKMASQDQIAVQAAERKAFWGQKFDDIENQVDSALETAGQAGFDPKKVADKIRSEVIEPLLKDAPSRRVGRQVENEWKQTLEYLDDAAASQKGMSVYDARRLRKKIDDYQIVYDKTKQTPKDLEMIRARNIWESEIEDAVKRAGLDDAYKLAKERYAVNRWAEKATQELQAGNLARRFVSPSDNIIGAATAIAQAAGSGGVGLGTLVAGALGSQANRVLRERTSQFVAGSLYELQKKTLFKQAVAAETALSDAAEGLMAKAMRGGARIAVATRNAAPVLGARVILGDAKTHEDATQRIADLQNPDSIARATLKMNLSPLASVDPEGAAAIEGHVQRVADFLASKAGPTVAIGTGAGAFDRFAPPKHDSASTAKLARYAEAAENPMGAFDRLKKGDVRKEDVETLQALYPRIYQRFAAKVQADMAAAKKRPPYEARVALSVATGVPADKSMRPDVVRKLQQAARPTDMERSELSPQSRATGKSPNLANVYQTKNDRLTAGRMGS